MIIQHNIPALNAHRQLGVNNSSLSKNLEKLSSGYRINRAADDAAGLAISEKMRAQITGLNRAVLNAQDGASLIQSAEGALQEVHGMLNRMVELATQSANGTIQADDRQKIEAEVEALKDEVDRISKATNFNGIQLLDGSLGAKNVKNIDIKGLTGAAGTTAVATNASSTFTVTNTTATAGQKLTYSVALNDGSSYNFEFTVAADGASMVSKDGTSYALGTANQQTAAELGNAIRSEAGKVGDLSAKFDISNTAGAITLKAKESGSAGVEVSSVGVNNNGTVSSLTPTVTHGLDETKGFQFTAFTGGNIDNATFSVNGVKFVVADSAANAALVTDKSVNVLIAAGNTPADYASVAQQVASKTGVKVDNLSQNGTASSALVFHSQGSTGLTMQVGDTADDFNKITVKVDDMSSTGLGIRDVSLATQESASAALSKIKDAIGKVSDNRGNLGALQNRLEHTINNLNVTSENMTAAESRIRDVDMAKEMMNFTKNNVLSQAAQAMLAQANQQPQQVLQLLR